MKEETTRDLVRTFKSDDFPLPPWARVTMRATLEDELELRRAPFTPLAWMETAVPAGVGLAIAALVLWVIFAS